VFAIESHGKAEAGVTGNVEIPGQMGAELAADLRYFARTSERVVG